MREWLMMHSSSDLLARALPVGAPSQVPEDNMALTLDHTAYTLSSTMFELLAHPDELQKVKDELAAAVPDKNHIPSFSEVENLPHFNACIQEILRLHPGVLSRMPRLSPEVEIVYNDQRRGRTYKIPPGTTTSMSTYIMHTNPDVFEDPLSFRPQRWLDNSKQLNRAFIAFSRGSRNCVG